MRNQGRGFTLGDKLSAVTAPSVAVPQTPALARTLIKASLHCAPSLHIPLLIWVGGLISHSWSGSSWEPDSRDLVWLIPTLSLDGLCGP